jgi:hypothetical protein
VSEAEASQGTGSSASSELKPLVSLRCVSGAGIVARPVHREDVGGKFEEVLGEPGGQQGPDCGGAYLGKE